MAGSGTKGGCPVTLNNMKNKAPAEMYEKKRKKGSYFQQQELEMFLEINSWLYLFANRTTSCSILELAVFDELLG